MNKKILIVKNITHEGPGLFLQVLAKFHLPYDVVELDLGDVFPPVEQYGAVVVLGGPQSANDTSICMQEQIGRVQECLDADIPFLGIGLGLQVLVKAAGGHIIPNPVKEVGLRDPNNEFFTLQATPDGKNDPLFTHLHDEIPIFQLHTDTVIPTPHMMTLATGKYCYYQLLKVGKRAYGVQGHVEVTGDVLHHMLELDTDLQIVNKQFLLHDFYSWFESHSAKGIQLFENFLTIAELV